METRSELFRRLRKEMGLSQTDLARAMGMTQAGVSCIETGKRNPTKVQMALIALLSKDKTSN